MPSDKGGYSVAPTSMHERGSGARGGHPSSPANGRGPRGSVPSGMTSVRLGDLGSSHGGSGGGRGSGRGSGRKGLVVGLSVLLVAALILTLYLVLRFSNLLTIDNVDVRGADHLTESDINALVSIPQGATLFSVDAEAIEKSLLRDAWVQDVKVETRLPGTLAIDITERTITAVVEVPSADAMAITPWAIASDGMWLMPIPDQDSELGQAISPQIYEDAAQALHISDVPYGTTPEIGAYCNDANVNNALAIVDGLTTDLSQQVKRISATDAESTVLTLENGVQIAFGPAENIREKERVCLAIMREHEGEVAYINVRVVDRPTWRAL